MQPVRKRLLNTSDLIKTLGFSRRAVDLFIERKIIPEPVRIGGRRYWAADAIDQWLAEIAAKNLGDKPEHAEKPAPTRRTPKAVDRITKG